MGFVSWEEISKNFLVVTVPSGKSMTENPGTALYFAGVGLFLLASTSSGAGTIHLVYSAVKCREDTILQEGDLQSEKMTALELEKSDITCFYLPAMGLWASYSLLRVLDFVLSYMEITVVNPSYLWVLHL